MTEVKHDRVRSTRRGAGPDTALRVLVRADSQARSLGEGVVDHRDPRLWSAVLEGALRSEGLDVYVENAGVAGLRIGDAWRGYERDHLVRDEFEGADAVILAMGVNDWWPLARPRRVADAMERIRPLWLRAALHRAYQRARPSLVRWSNGRFRPTPPREARHDLEQFVAALQRRHGVALVTPLPVSSPRNPGFDGNTTEAAATVVDVARVAGVPAIDTHQLFAPMAWDEISADHVHVNPAGHAVIAQAVAGALGPTLADASERREADRRRAEGRLPATRVVLRCDLNGLAPPSAIDDRDLARCLAVRVERELAARGHADAGVVDGCFRGLDTAYLHHSVLHDPLVRDPIAASEVTLLGLTPPRHVGAHASEAYGWLVSVVEDVTRPVLVIPPCLDGRRARHRRFRRLVTRVARERALPLVDLSDLIDAGRGPSLDLVATRLARAVDDHLAAASRLRPAWRAHG